MLNSHEWIMHVIGCGGGTGALPSCTYIRSTVRYGTACSLMYEEKNWYGTVSRYCTVSERNEKEI